MNAMALSYKQRRKWALLILIVGLPLYIIVAFFAVSLLPRPNILVELAIYVVLGIVWVMPFKSIFMGIGQADPDAPPKD